MLHQQRKLDSVFSNLTVYITFVSSPGTSSQDCVGNLNAIVTNYQLANKPFAILRKLAKIIWSLPNWNAEYTADFYMDGGSYVHENLRLFRFRVTSGYGLKRSLNLTLIMLLTGLTVTCSPKLRLPSLPQNYFLPSRWTRGSTGSLVSSSFFWRQMIIFDATPNSILSIFTGYEFI